MSADLVAALSLIRAQDLVIAECVEALRIAEMQINNDLVMRIQQPVERSANELILEVIRDALSKAERKRRACK